MYHWCSKGSYRYVRPFVHQALEPALLTAYLWLNISLDFRLSQFLHICIKHAGDGGSFWKVFIGLNCFLCIDICFCCIYLKFSLLICYSSPSKYKLDRWFVKRFWRCWKVMTPSCSSTTFLLFVLLVGFALAGKKARTIISKNRFR